MTNDKKIYNTAGKCRISLKKLLDEKKYITAIDASFIPMIGVFVENIKEFDAMFYSGLCDSTYRAKPDKEIVNLSKRLNTINEIMEVTTKPLIFDFDTGGKTEDFYCNIQKIEKCGISAIMIEDKITGLKKNSLLGKTVKHELANPDEFAEKIRIGKKAQTTQDFMIIARCESLIAGLGVENAIERSKKYAEAGADVILIHSNGPDGQEIFDFISKFKTINKKISIAVIPTTYNQFSTTELNEKGANIVIYANQITRSMLQAGKATLVDIAKAISNNIGIKEISEKHCMSAKELIELIPENKL